MPEPSTGLSITDQEARQFLGFDRLTSATNKHMACWPFCLHKDEEYKRKPEIKTSRRATSVDVATGAYNYSDYEERLEVSRETSWL